MKKILFLILLIVSINSFGQFPNQQGFGTATTVTNINGAGRSWHGFINGVFNDTLAANADQIDFYTGAQIYTRSDLNFWIRDSLPMRWTRIARYTDVTAINQKFGHPSGDYSTTENRTVNFHDTHTLRFDSLNSLLAYRSGILRLYVNNISSGLFSPDGLNSLQTSDAVVQMNFNSGANYLWGLQDSFLLHKKISYEGNIHSTFKPFSLIDKSYADSIVAASVPTLQQVTTAGNRTTNEIHVYNGSSDSVIIQPAQISVQSGGIADAVFSPGYIYAQNGLGLRWMAGSEFGMRNASSINNTALKNIDPSASNEFYLRETNTGSHRDTLATLKDILDAGGGGGGSDGLGLLHVVGGWGLINVNDSTVRIDSTNVPTKAANDKFRDSLFAILNTVNNPKDAYQYYLDISGQSNTAFNLAVTGSGSALTRPNTPFLGEWYGNVKLSLGTTTTGTAYGHYNPSLVYFPLSSAVRYNFGTRVRFEDLSDGTDTYKFWVGYYDDHYTPPASLVDGVFFTYTHSESSGQFVCHTMNNSTESNSASGVTVAADTDYYLQISVFGGDAKFYINGTLVATISTNIPDDDINRTVSIELTFKKSAGTTNRDMYLGQFSYGTLNY